MTEKLRAKRDCKNRGTICDDDAKVWKMVLRNRVGVDYSSVLLCASSMIRSLAAQMTRLLQRTCIKQELSRAASVGAFLLLYKSVENEVLL